MSIAPVTTPGLGLLGKRPPTHMVEVDGQRVTRSAAELPSKVRRFLLLEQPKLSGGFDACAVMFYSILMVPDDSLNSTALLTHSCFSLGEILAILAGLSIALPISLRAATSIDVDVVDWATAPRWNVAVNLGSTVVTSTLFLCIITSCVGAMFASVGSRFRGAEAVAFYMRVVDVLGIALFWWSLSINLLFLLVGAHTYHTVGHPAPAVAVVVMLLMGQGLAFLHFIKNLMCAHMPLEVLHLPLWWRLIVVASWPPARPWLLPPGGMDGKYLAAAKQRARRLLYEAGYEVPTEEP